MTKLLTSNEIAENLENQPQKFKWVGFAAYKNGEYKGFCKFEDREQAEKEYELKPVELLLTINRE